MDVVVGVILGMVSVMVVVFIMAASVTLAVVLCLLFVVVVTNSFITFCCRSEYVDDEVLSGEQIVFFDESEKNTVFKRKINFLLLIVMMS